MHLDEGTLRSYLDQELDQARFKQVEEHLDTCGACAERLEILRARSDQVRHYMGALDLGGAAPPLPVNSARAQLTRKINSAPQKQASTWEKITGVLPRPGWVGAAVLALLAVSMTFPPVRTMANTFLGLFRVEQVRVVEINSVDLPEDLASSAQFEFMMSENVNVREMGETQEVASLGEASQMAGFQVRLPSAIDGKRTLKVQPGGELTFNVVLEQVRTVLSDIGRSDIELPDSLDGAQVLVEVPSSVAAQYGDCDFDPEKEGMDIEDMKDHEGPIFPDCTTLIQMPSPTISAPPELDIIQLGEAFLQITGMSPEEAASFSQNVDWTTTLVIPIPRYGTEYQDVLVDGVTGTFIQQFNYKDENDYLLIWVKDGILYALSGMGDETIALQIADSLQ